MSKSIGNTIVPEEIVQAIRRRHPAALGGADRLYRSTSASVPEILKGVADSYRRLRNTMRYMLGSV